MLGDRETVALCGMPLRLALAIWPDLKGLEHHFVASVLPGTAAGVLQNGVHLCLVPSGSSDVDTARNWSHQASTAYL